MLKFLEIQICLKVMTIWTDDSVHVDCLLWATLKVDGSQQPHDDQDSQKKPQVSWDWVSSVLMSREKRDGSVIVEFSNIRYWWVFDLITTAVDLWDFSLVLFLVQLKARDIQYSFK